AGIPAVSLWGSVHAEAPGEYLEFTLSPYVPAESPDHRPGHSWVITPELTVLDVALRHQAHVYQNYDELRERIPGVVAVDDCNTVEPEERWVAPAGRTKLLREERDDAFKYLDVLGWSESNSSGLRLRYVPSAVQVPDSDWNLFTSLPRIGGMTPGRFLRKCLKQLVHAATN
ncbi:MAG: hypothetical protein LC808_01690, partial [Actinobacteria bacterium]|nr:hypothetical protein [Actinomycetota bacterium]